MTRWIARATLAALVLVPALLLKVDVSGGPLFYPEHTHHGYGYMPLSLFLLNAAGIMVAIFAAAALLVVLFAAAFGKLDR